MIKLDTAFTWAVTLGIVVPVFTFCWCRGAVMVARERIRGVATASA
jgi:hypothetical protein